jgi:hypothetical protein
MKKLTTFEHGNFSLWRWAFTEEERAEFRTFLAAFPASSVEAFLDDLQVLCSGMRAVMKGPKRADLRNDKERILKRLNNAFKELRRLADRKVVMDNWDQIPDLIGRTHDRELEAQNTNWRYVMDALCALQKIIPVIEAAKPPGGRPGADPFGFVSRIAAKWEEHFKVRPKPYRSSRDTKQNAFFYVVVNALNAVEIKIEDPSRHIAKALKSADLLS